MFIPENDLREVVKLHEKSLHLQAYKLAHSIAPLPNWEGTDARLLAANLAFNLGATETSRKWTANVWRKNKTHPRALFYHGTDILHRRGALPALIFVRKHDPEFRADAKLQSWWFCLHAE